MKLPEPLRALIDKIGKSGASAPETAASSQPPQPRGTILPEGFSLEAYLDGAPTVFDKPIYDDLNRARMDHLASLGLDLAGASVLEVGAGVGRLTGFFLERGCRVTATDSREENLVELRRRLEKAEENCTAETLRNAEKKNEDRSSLRPPRLCGESFSASSAPSVPSLRAVCADLSREGDHSRLGRFDIVFMYGVLYHLADPALALRELSACCGRLFLLETVVSHADNGQVNRVEEPAQIPDQSMEGRGCRPGRDWVFAELRRHFEHVYLPATQPAHPQFSTRWPAGAAIDLPRAIFIASRAPLTNTAPDGSPLFLDHVPATQRPASSPSA